MRRLCRGSAVAGLSIAIVLCGPIPGTAAELTFELRVEHGQVPESMRLIRVMQGDVVKLRWTSDRPITVHLHGYDIERQVVPGVPSEVAFTARATGRFPVYIHARGTAGHAHGEAPLVDVEVYPR